MKRKDLYKEIKATTIIVSVIGVIFLLIYSLKNEKFQNFFWISFLVYFATTVLLFLISTFIKNKYLDKVTSFLLYPLGIIYIILTVIMPFYSLLGHLLLYFGIAFFIPEILYRALSYFHLIDFINEPTAIYLRITLTVFICVLLNPIIRDLVYRISPERPKPSEKLKPYEIHEMTNYFLSNNNIKFFVYGIYVVVLLMTNIFNLQGKSLNNEIEIDKAVLQSFVTFIAFDRAITLMKQLDFRPSVLLNKISRSIIEKLNTNVTNENNRH